MDFAQQQRNPTKHIVGMALVILLHIGIVYALLHGLARRVVEVIQQPLETKIIEEVKPPPPPEVLPPPMPKMAAPPPPFIPPPEVQIQQPPPPAPTITAVTNTPPPPEAPAPVAPPPAAPAAPAPAPPAPSVGVVCPNVGAVAGELKGRFERLAQKEGISSADVTVEFTVGPNGEVKDEHVVQSTNRAVNSLALGGVKRLGCKGQGHDVRLLAPFVFNMKD